MHKDSTGQVMTPFQQRFGKPYLYYNDDDDDIFNCKWAVARWQWLLCMYIYMK